MIEDLKLNPKKTFESLWVYLYIRTISTLELRSKVHLFLQEKKNLVCDL